MKSILKKTMLALTVGILADFSYGCGIQRSVVNPSATNASAEQTIPVAENSNTEDKPIATPDPVDEKYDIDLVGQSSTVVYSEIYNMIMKPEDYKGKTLRISGIFSEGTGVNGETILGCVITDATQCCVQGIQFSWKDHIYPEDYPDLGTKIIIAGVLDYTAEGYSIMLQMMNAEMTVINS